MCNCFLPSCCCGWQTLEHGLFMFALVDIGFNLLMIGFNAASTFSSFLLLSGFLMVADIGLAVGAKLGIRLLLLIWLGICFILILLSVVLPPLYLLLVVVFDQFGTNHQGDNHSGVLDKLVNLDLNRSSHVQFYLNFLVRFVLGVFYIYIWVMVRSLYIVMGRIGYSGKTDEGVFVAPSGSGACHEDDQAMRMAERSSTLVHRHTANKFPSAHGGINPSGDSLATFPHSASFPNSVSFPHSASSAHYNSPLAPLSTMHRETPFV